MTDTTSSEARGRHAHSPGDIPSRGWKDVALRVKDEVADDRLSIVSAGLAYYAMLSIFPALIAFIAIYGLVVSPGQAEDQVSELAAGLPEEALAVLVDQVRNLASASTTGLGWAALASIGGALWVASGGVQQLMQALDIVYDEEEGRGFVKLRATALAITLGVFVLGGLALGLIAAVPAILDAVELGGLAESLIGWGRWLVLAVLASVALAAIYRYAPDRDQPRWQWVTWGSAVATVLWLVASALFSLYVSNFGSFNETYGSLAGVIVLMLWFFLTGFLVLLGGEVNAEMEHQTVEDTTRGERRPLGGRDARMADTVGERRSG